MRILAEQYELVKSSRAVMLDFCAKLATEDLLRIENSGKSIRYLLVHIANTYQKWLENFIQQKKYPFIETDAVTNVDDMKQFFDRIDNVTANFITRYGENPQALIHGKVPEETELIGITPLKLFTHVITHEFHHKGQIMALARRLGYVPPDADVIR